MIELLLSMIGMGIALLLIGFGVLIGHFVWRTTSRFDRASDELDAILSHYVTKQREFVDKVDSPTKR